MEKIGHIKIDQIRLNLPCDSVPILSTDHEMPLEVEKANSIFKLDRVFDNYDLGYGHNGYTNSCVYGLSDQGRAASISWNPDRSDMGISIDFTATGKDLYEQLCELKGIEVDWRYLIKQVVNDYGGHISRIDIATDLINYGFSVDSICRRLNASEITVLNMRKRRIPADRFRIVGTMESRQTLYVGSRSSDAFLRIYDKKTEQNRPNGTYRGLAQQCEDWIRVEAEFKHRVAKSIGQHISKYDGDNFYQELLGIVLERWTMADEEDQAN